MRKQEINSKFYQIGENMEKEPRMVELRNQVGIYIYIYIFWRSCITVLFPNDCNTILSCVLWSQCRIIRTTELAAAQERLNELERQKEETLKSRSPSSLLQRLQGMQYL